MVRGNYRNGSRAPFMRGRTSSISAAEGVGDAPFWCGPAAPALPFIAFLSAHSYCD
jgi:hypothetical protein